MGSGGELLVGPEVAARAGFRQTWRGCTCHSTRRVCLGATDVRSCLEASPTLRGAITPWRVFLPSKRHRSSRERGGGGRVHSNECAAVGARSPHIPRL